MPNQYPPFWCSLVCSCHSAARMFECPFWLSSGSKSLKRPPLYSAPRGSVVWCRQTAVLSGIGVVRSWQSDPAKMPSYFGARIVFPHRHSAAHILGEIHASSSKYFIMLPPQSRASRPAEVVLLRHLRPFGRADLAAAIVLRAFCTHGEVLSASCRVSTPRCCFTAWGLCWHNLSRWHTT